MRRSQDHSHCLEETEEFIGSSHRRETGQVISLLHKSDAARSKRWLGRRRIVGVSLHFAKFERKVGPVKPAFFVLIASKYNG